MTKWVGRSPAVNAGSQAFLPVCRVRRLRCRAADGIRREGSRGPDSQRCHQLQTGQDDIDFHPPKINKKSYLFYQ